MSAASIFFSHWVCPPRIDRAITSSLIAAACSQAEILVLQQARHLSIEAGRDLSASSGITSSSTRSTTSFVPAALTWVAPRRLPVSAPLWPGQASACFASDAFRCSLSPTSWLRAVLCFDAFCSYNVVTRGSGSLGESVWLTVPASQQREQQDSLGSTLPRAPPQPCSCVDPTGRQRNLELFPKAGLLDFGPIRRRLLCAGRKGCLERQQRQQPGRASAK